MTVKNLYRYERPDGGVTVSPEMPEDVPYTLMFRLIADEGKILVKDEIRVCCADTDSVDGWTEVEEEEESEGENDS